MLGSRWLLALLRRITDAELADSIVGDLEQERRRIGSPTFAFVWYWREAAAVVVRAIGARIVDALRDAPGGSFITGSPGDLRYAFRSLGANLRLLRGRQTDLRCYECPLPIFPEPRSGRWGQARTGGTGSTGPNVRPVHRDREDIVDNRSVIDAHHARHRWEVIVEPDPERLLVVMITAYPIE
jgi:hypothetical protein